MSPDLWRPVDNLIRLVSGFFDRGYFMYVVIIAFIVFVVGVVITLALFWLDTQPEQQDSPERIALYENISAFCKEQGFTGGWHWLKEEQRDDLAFTCANVTPIDTNVTKYYYGVTP